MAASFPPFRTPHVRSSCPQDCLWSPCQPQHTLFLCFAWFFSTALTSLEYAYPCLTPPAPAHHMPVVTLVPKVDLQDTHSFPSPPHMISLGGNYWPGTWTRFSCPPLFFPKSIPQPECYSCCEVLLWQGFQERIDLSHRTLNLLITLDVAFKIARVRNSIWCWAYEKGLEEIALCLLGIICFWWWKIDRFCWSECLAKKMFLQS